MPTMHRGEDAARARLPSIPLDGAGHWDTAALAAKVDQLQKAMSDREPTLTVSADPEISLGTLVSTVVTVRGAECIAPEHPDPRCPFGEIIVDVAPAEP